MISSLCIAMHLQQSVKPTDTQNNDGLAASTIAAELTSFNGNCIFKIVSTTATAMLPIFNAI